MSIKPTTSSSEGRRSPGLPEPAQASSSQMNALAALGLLYLAQQSQRQAPPQAISSDRVKSKRDDDGGETEEPGSKRQRVGEAFAGSVGGQNLGEQLESGSETTPYGSKIEFKHKNGIRQGDATNTLKGLLVTTFKYVNNQPEGDAKMTFQDRTILEFKYTRGQYNGDAKQICPDGSYLEFQFVNGLVRGPLIYYHPLAKAKIKIEYDSDIPVQSLKHLIDPIKGSLEKYFG